MARKTVKKPVLSTCLNVNDDIYVVVDDDDDDDSLPLYARQVCEKEI